MSGILAVAGVIYLPSIIWIIFIPGGVVWLCWVLIAFGVPYLNNNWFWMFSLLWNGGWLTFFLHSAGWETGLLSAISPDFSGGLRSFHFAGSFVRRGAGICYDPVRGRGEDWGRGPEVALR